MKTKLIASICRSTQLLLALGGLSLAIAVQAAVTDIATAPLLSATATPVKPNVLFILDDSGSMASDYLPEEAGFSSSKYGRKAAQCNGLAFDPSQAYPKPVDGSGTAFADASWTNLMNAYLYTASNSDRYVSFVSPTTNTPVTSGSITMTVSGKKPSGKWYPVGSEVAVYDADHPTRWMLGTVTSWDTSDQNGGTLTVAVVAASTTSLNLDKPAVGVNYPPVWYFSYSGSQSKLGYTFDSAGSVQTGTTFYGECNSLIGSTPGSGVFTRQFLTLNDSNLQKFANWSAYYSTRMKMMQTVVSLAFKDIDSKFRVGYDTILNYSMAESSGNNNFLHIRDFGSTQKTNFYTMLHGPKNSGWTPLRGALSNAGRYFANKAPGQDLDPLQYSCQKNFTILATDGAWNTNSETTTYGPFMLDGTTTVGQQDGSAALGMKDASAANGTGGSSDSLADVAMYFYNTDLRTTALNNCTLSDGTDVCANNVAPLGKDTATWQHMTTYTMSLGQSGTIKYDPNYETTPSGDFLSLTQGNKQWPNPSDGANAANVDDLWHAAVNGRGKFFNAADPSAVSSGLNAALTQIAQLTGSGSAAALSTLQPVAGNNSVYIARYTSSIWTGDLRAYLLNLSTGAPLVLDGAGNDIATWSAAARLKLNNARKIYYYKAGTGLRDFTYANLTADSMTGYVDNRCSAMSHCASLGSTDQATANSGSELVSYLRGTEKTVYRARTEMLGDMVGSSPVFVSAPPLSYSDSGYASYKTNQRSRKAMVYVGANDGMLHAFDAQTGDEVWAFIPSMVLGNLYKLADRGYSSAHQFYVDATPVAADVYDGTNWRTILVGGLGAGGKGYYALDITDPEHPAALWEFTNTNLGLSFAQPVITKRSNGTWVVALSSGYNNVGDGLGHLFLLNAVTGSLLLDLSTSAGSAATPAGLGPLNAWVIADTNNRAERFYAGDTLGNLWRFDTEATSPTVVQLAQLKVGTKVQPITTAPQLAEVDYRGYKAPVVFVGTGKMLGLSDMTNADQQSIYAIKDNLSATGLGDVRAGSTLVEQTLVTTGSVRTASANPVDWTLKNGWFVDLPDSRERINVDMSLQFNTLVAASNIPQSVASCTPGGGSSWLYYLDIANGSNTGSNVGVHYANSLITGITIEALHTGNGVIVNFFGQPPQAQPVPKPPVPSSSTKRASWRELVDR
ncbi:PilC/PilY family type IV pilus protein [Paucibacter sp. APW11]|uniref:PilC/PilY family type IV pilus protein n=1 Tax=Roseateles aquae TaxID=3077235 RepID=A0ABU3PI86_9BURK|nr:PilC/PilY family type IV pilus protein [Paucibacter sp. APW11]MDT9002135.1 PilC/PilY family type IV pilus protein [Paucibacter sp. APW11]